MTNVTKVDLKSCQILLPTLIMMRFVMCVCEFEHIMCFVWLLVELQTFS